MYQAPKLERLGTFREVTLAGGDLTPATVVTRIIGTRRSANALPAGEAKASPAGTLALPSSSPPSQFRSHRRLSRERSRHFRRLSPLGDPAS